MCYRRRMRSGASLATLALLFLAARPARAFERQQHFGFDAGGVVMTTSSNSQPGITLGLHYTYGLTDAFNFVAEAGGSTFETGGSKGPQPGWLGYGGAGLMYVFDVMRWVPYAGVIVGGAGFANGEVGKAFLTPDVQLGAGLDYAFTREWSAGVAYRQHLFVTQMDTYPEYTAVTLRVEYVWGW
jgi:hypothetical protein